MTICFFGGFALSRRFGESFSDVTVPLQNQSEPVEPTAKKRNQFESSLLVIADDDKRNLLIERNPRESHIFPGHNLLSANRFVFVDIDVKDEHFAIGCNGSQNRR